MDSVRINISLPKRTFKELSRNIEPGKRSRFIAQAVIKSLKEIRNERLAAEYEEAAAETRRINQELEGVTADGLD